MSEPNCANPYYEEVETALDFDRAKGTAEGLIWSDESSLEFYLGKTALGNLARCYLAIEQSHA